MTTEKTDKTDKNVKNSETKETKETWLDQHDLTEIIATTNLDILPKYEIIAENDLITSRKVIIDSIPVRKFISKANKDLDYITIIDSGIKYNLPFNSIALQRSYISLAIKECKATTIKEIDFSKILGKMYGIKREQFTINRDNTLYTQAPLKFFILEK